MQIRGENNPPTFAEYVRQPAIFEVEKHLFDIFYSLVDNPGVGNKINETMWRVVDVPACCHPLLTSDRPVIRTNGLARKGGHIALPIGPRNYSSRPMTGT